MRSHTGTVPDHPLVDLADNNFRVFVRFDLLPMLPLIPMQLALKATVLIPLLLTPLLLRVSGITIIINSS